MKKTFRLCMALLLVVSFALSLSSCKDSEDATNGPTPEEMAQSKESDSAKGLLSVLSFTSQLDSLPDNWYSNSYTVEPTVGTVNDQSTPFVRYVPVLNKEEAIAKYSSIAHQTMAEGSTSATFNIENVGSVKFNVLDQADCTATLDLNIKQQPHLTQIRFVPASAMGENAKLDGKPYYNFGDIVELDEHGRKTYWICVRPCSQKEKKSTSHWMSFNLNAWDLKDINNFKKITKSNCGDYYLPTQLGNESGSSEHLENLFRLLYILDNPGRYNLLYKDGLGGISQEELSSDDVHNMSEIWEAKNYWQRVLPEGMPLNTLTSCFKGHESEINVFYYGYHYSRVFGNTASVHRAIVGGNDLHTIQDGEIKWSRGEAGVDFRSYASTGLRDAAMDPNAGLPEKAFIVRYKTGRQLIGGGSGNDEDPTNSFTDKHSGKIEDICVYGKLKNNLSIGASLVGDWISNEPLNNISSKNITWYCALGYADGNPQFLGRNAYYLKYKNPSKYCETVSLQDLPTTALAYVNLLNAVLYTEYKQESGYDGDVLSEEYKAALNDLGLSISSDFQMLANSHHVRDILSLQLYDTDGNWYRKDGNSSKLGKVIVTMPYADSETAAGYYKKAKLEYDVQNRTFTVTPSASEAKGITTGVPLFELKSFVDIGDTPDLEGSQRFYKGVRDKGEIKRETAKTKAAEYIRQVAANITL